VAVARKLTKEELVRDTFASVLKQLAAGERIDAGRKKLVYLLEEDVVELVEKIDGALYAIERKQDASLDDDAPPRGWEAHFAVKGQRTDEAREPPQRVLDALEEAKAKYPDAKVAFVKAVEVCFRRRRGFAIIANHNGKLIRKWVEEAKSGE
jgi:hypothetical protein